MATGSVSGAEGRTIGNDLRLLANYAQRIEPIVARITAEEVAGLDEGDLVFLMHWAERAGIPLHNLANDCRAESRYREPDESRQVVSGDAAVPDGSQSGPEAT